MDDYEERQKQMRIKYGSNKTKQNYYSSRMGGVLGQPQPRSSLVTNKASATAKTRNTRTSSQTSSMSYQQQSSKEMTRQKSSGSVTAPGSG